MDYLGGRKFLAFILLVAVGVVAETTTKAGLSMNLVYLLLGLYGAFTASNVGVTLGALKHGALPSQDGSDQAQDEDVASQAPNEFQAPPAMVEAASAPALDVDSLNTRLNTIDARLAAVVDAIPRQNEALGFLVQDVQNRHAQLRGAMKAITD